MADAYNVRVNGERYFVYRLDGNVPVGEYIGEGAASKAQRDAAIRNQQHNERFAKKKEEQSTVPLTEGWVEGGDEPETTVGHPDKQPMDAQPDPEEASPSESESSDQTGTGTKPYPVPQLKSSKKGKK